MNKLLINKYEKQRFEKIFKFFSDNNCQAFLTPDGIDWRNDKANGLIYKDAFKEFQVEGKKRITITDNKKKTLNWIKNWKERYNLIEIAV